MLRRPGPNLFQRGARSALASNLVAPPQRLPGFRPQAGGVGTPQPLPGLIPYGPQPQGLEQNSRFSGGAVPSPMSLTRGDEVPPFHEPSYGAPAQSAFLNALAPVGPSHLPRPPGTPIAGPAATGAISPIGGGGGAFGGGSTSVAGVSAPGAVYGGGGGGYQIQPGLTIPTGLREPTPISSLSALIAALAQTGQRVNSGRISRI
jgi:hypothetical protein